jgi:exosortase family protein XrtF
VKVLDQLHKLIKNIPKGALLFLVKALFFYLIWTCAYHFYFQPKQLLDPPLTNSLTFLTFKIVKPIYANHLVTLSYHTAAPMILVDGMYNLKILDGCNALELYVFYIGFIICYGGSLKTSLQFILAGLAGIFVLNLIRCVVLSVLSFNHFRYIDSMHHYVFTIVVYSFILTLWFYFFKVSLNKKR